MFPILIIISMVSFAILQFQPGDYLTKYKLNPEYTAELIQRKAEMYGLDKPAYVQYWKWITGIFTRFDFGWSFETRQPVYESLFRGRLKWTFIITAMTMVFTWVLSIPIGIYAATHQYSVGDHTLTFFGFLGLSIPNFFFALIILWLLVVVFNVGDYGLGIGGLYDNEYIGQPWSFGKFLSFMWHMWPVILVIGTSGMAGLIRIMRGNLLDTLGAQYVQTARSKGLEERVVIYKHAVRNAINPLVSILGLSIPNLLSGSLIAAIMFQLPMVERAYWQALINQDQFVVMAGIVFFGFMLLVANIIADILLVLVDPRIRYH
jgi:peptide/nickel transport system permease protein